jgi:hypothetical protein
VTNPPAAVGQTGATLTGHVEPRGGPVNDCEFEYETKKSYENVREVSTTGASSGSFSMLFSESGDRVSKPIGLNATAAEFKSALGEILGNGVEVTGPAGGPWRVELTGSNAGKADQLVVGFNTLRPLAASVSVDLDSTKAPCVPAATSGSPFEAPTDVEADITGLNTGTTYFYRLAASDANGRAIGTEESFTPSSIPLSTGAATEIRPTTATLNGTVNPEGLETTYYFEYGPSKEYGQTTAAPPGTSLGTTEAGDQPASAPLSGLKPQLTYHYRLVAVNSKGTAFGADRTFETLPAVKGVTTEPASAIHRTDATLNGAVDPDGKPTTYYFEWGRSRRYGSVSAAPPGTAVEDTSPGPKHLSFLAEGLQPEKTYHFRIVAVNATGTTFGNDLTFTTLDSVKDVTTEAASEIEPTSATLNGSLDPDGIPGTTFYFQWGKTLSYGRTTPAPPGVQVGSSAPGTTQLNFGLENLEPGTTYHFRLVAVNSFGTTVGGDRTFETPQGPSIEAFSSANVTATGADLKARINPHGFPTTYRFEYGPTLGYGSLAPVPDGTLGPAKSGQGVTVPIEGLSPGVTYHFRLIAESQWGTVTTEDQTFDFEPPSCPNATVRQQTGAAYLPDCRAYELVSPGRAGGATLYAEGPTSSLAADRFTFTGVFNVIPGTGEPPNGGIPTPTGDLYVARRTIHGWVSHYVGLPGDRTLEQSGKPSGGTVPTPDSAILADRDLNHFLTWDGNAERIQSYAPYVWDAEGNPLGRLPADFESLPGSTTKPTEGGFIGDMQLSPDFSHYIFSSIRTAFAPDGLTASPGSVYDYDLETGTVTLISKTAGDADIAQDGIAGTSGEYIKIPALSTDGSHVLMSTQGPGGTTHLYLRVNDALTYEPSRGQDGINHGVDFAGMSSNGTEVFFTTAAQMTSDDHDSSVDLYRWSEATDSLTRLSTGVEGTGDSDACNSGWIEECGVEVVPTARPGFAGTVASPLDNSLAASSGEIYFYSPEQLDVGARGLFGQRNLYVYREGAPRFVATLDVSHPIERINVSPDGSHAAFITKTRLTAYENSGHAEMYTFDAAGRKIVCVSCLPDGEPPTADVQGSQNGIFMTDDGRAFFSTTDALVPRDANGNSDVYEYVNGRPQLISSGTGNDTGTGERAPGLVGVSADGTDAFISTFQTLVAQDENGPFLKFYDARVNGGFPFSEQPAPCAAADECHGEGSLAPPPAQIGSGAALGPGGNATGPRRHKHRKHHHRRAPHRHHHKTRHHHRGAQR